MGTRLKFVTALLGISNIQCDGTFKQHSSISFQILANSSLTPAFPPLTTHNLCSWNSIITWSKNQPMALNKSQSIYS